MVSLGDESRHSGGHFFTSEPQNEADTEELLRDSDSLRSVHKGVPVKFHKIKTMWTTPLLVLILICLEVSVFIAPHCVHLSAPPSTFSLLLYAHVVVSFLFFLGDRLARWQHHISRKQGYLEFYRHTCNLRRFPFLIVSGGNAILLILTTLVHDYCDQSSIPYHNHTFTSPSSPYTIGESNQNSTPQAPAPDVHRCLDLPLTPDNYLQIVCSVEVAVLIPILLLYFVKVVRFNRRATAPDVLDQDNSTTSIMQSQNSPMEIGFSEDPCMEEVMEKQAEMIRYLKEHNSALGRRVMELTSLKAS